LLAVEETSSDGRRVIRPPRRGDAAPDERVTAAISRSSLKAPDALVDDIDSGRPAGYGFKSLADLFTRRQIATFLEAFEWLSHRDLPQEDRRGMLLGISNALATNNLLCGYASNYGRLSPLFSVRSYSMPVLSVELNPLHLTGGRGTLRNTLLRVARSQVKAVQRHTLQPKTRRLRPHSFVARRETRHHIVCQSADRPFPRALGKLDLAVTDPPYYDYISYSDLSLFFRAWLGAIGEQDELAGAPLYPLGETAMEEFAERLGRAFTHIRAVLKEAAPLVFTFHSINQDAWGALEKALLKSRLVVTGLFPIWTDARSGGHRHEGNCEWDIVFVCRRAKDEPSLVDPDLDAWLRRLRSFKIGVSDKRSMKMAIAVASNVNASLFQGQRF
jgi:putative DNA methylase